MTLSRRAALAGALALATAAARAEEVGPATSEPGAPKRTTPPAKTREPKAGLSFPPRPAWQREGRVEREGVRLWYGELGPASGEPVLFLHGGLGNSDHWARQAAHLAGQGRRVLVMDTRGHGRSPVSPAMRFGFAAFAGDAEAVLDGAGAARAAIAGWSDGAITGLQLAMTRPDRVARLFAFGANVTPAGLIAGGSRRPLFQAYAARCRRDYADLSPNAKAWPDLNAGMGAMWRREPNIPRQSLRAIRVPVTVAAGDGDEIIRLSHARDIAEDVRSPGGLRTFKDASHFAMLQAPAAFNDALDRFLS